MQDAKVVVPATSSFSHCLPCVEDDRSWRMTLGYPTLNQVVMLVAAAEPDVSVAGINHHISGTWCAGECFVFSSE